VHDLRSLGAALDRISDWRNSKTLAEILAKILAEVWVDVLAGDRLLTNDTKAGFQIHCSKGKFWRRPSDFARISPIRNSEIHSLEFRQSEILKFIDPNFANPKF
jgi:hypothetical protein